MAFVLIQHLDPTHESILASLLGRASSMPVHEVANKMRVKPNNVYVIPPKTNMTLEASTLHLTGRIESRSNTCRWTIFCHRWRDRGSTARSA